MSTRTVAKGWHKHHPWRVVKDGDRFRAQWLCKLLLRKGHALICGRYYKTKEAAETASKANIDKKPVSAIAKGGRFDKWTWPPYSKRNPRSPDHNHACALPGELETEERAVKDDVSRARLAAAAQGIAQTRQALMPSPTAAPMAAPARRAKALEMNAAGLQEQGF